MTRACLDRAFHEWILVRDADVIGALAPALGAVYGKDSDHRPKAVEAIDRRLQNMASHLIPQ